jgi:hypothetical protein
MLEEYQLKQMAAQNQACGQLGYAIQAHIQPPTVGENIDRQIEIHRSAIARLEETRANLDKANLLNIKISDLREAMQY